MPNPLLENLDPEQQRAAAATSGRVAILAVAGAGKTRTITHRIAHAIASEAQDPRTGLALSYTTKSAAELKARLAGLGVADFATATIHGAAWRQLKHFWPKALGGKPWQLINNRARVFESAAERAGLNLSAAELRILQVEIEKLKALGLDADTHKDFSENANPDLTELWQYYSEYCTKSRLLDFDDMLQLLLGVLQNRPDALSEVQQRYRWFTVDEYQDITPLQHQLLNLWVGSSEEICVVGDPTQSIYEFAGAVPNLLKEFVAAPNTKVITLNQTYRVSSAIAEVANPIASWLGEQQLRSVRDGGRVSVDVYPNSESEITGVLHRIMQLQASGQNLGGIAVLLRTGAAVNEVAAKLEQSNIPVVTRSAGRFIDSMLVKQVLLTLKLVGDSTQSSVFEIVQSTVAGVGWGPRWSDSGLPLSDWLGLSSIVELSKIEVSSISEFLELVGDQVLSMAEPPADAVSVFTIHQAKGLEWDCVFLPGFHELTGLSDTDAVAEARVQYVALTRARDQVLMSYSNTDRFGRKQELSRFVSNDLPVAPTLPNLAKAEVVAAEPTSQLSVEFCDECKGALRSVVEVMTRWCSDCVKPANAELEVELLRARAEVAANHNIPAWALISDAAVKALSIRPPKQNLELEYFPALKRLSPSELDLFTSIWR